MTIPRAGSRFIRRYPRGVDSDETILQYVKNLDTVASYAPELGWPPLRNTTEALDFVQCFQEGWGLGDRLGVDRWPGRLTVAAMRQSIESDGYAWLNFRWREFASKGNGWVRLRYELGFGIQTVRTIQGGPVEVWSGYRDDDHNAIVTGKPDSDSRHLYGEACDTSPVDKVVLATARQLGLFAGFGVLGASSPDPELRVPTHWDVGGLCVAGRRRSGGKAE